MRIGKTGDATRTEAQTTHTVERGLNRNRKGTDMQVQERRDRVKAFKKDTILEAARNVFAEKGLSGSSIRSIAAASGYTPGAIYSYFESKEQIYAEILASVLDDLLAEVERATSGAQAPARAAITAVYAYYATRADEYHLSYYLFEGMRRKGLTPELDDMLNARLARLANAIGDALAASYPSSPRKYPTGVLGTMAHVSGILLLHHTGRLKTFGVSGPELIEDYIALLDAS